MCIFGYGFGVLTLDGQLWRLLVASAVCPGLWRPEERTDEGKFVKYESRQLGGCGIKSRRGVERR